MSLHLMADLEHDSFANDGRSHEMNADSWNDFVLQLENLASRLICCGGESWASIAAMARCGPSRSLQS